MDFFGIVIGILPDFIRGLKGFHFFGVVTGFHPGL
jgi:hypothetical protein